jgi:hypothetical protein
MKPEQQLVHQTMQWLELKGILHYRTRTSGTMIHTPRGMVFGRDKYFRSQKGCPDILAWRAGKAYALELKSQKGRVTPEQSAWIDRFEREGFTARVVRSLDEVIAVFEK